MSGVIRGAAIAGLHVKAFISDAAAASIAYGLVKKPGYSYSGDQTKTILFLNIGFNFELTILGL